MYSKKELLKDLEKYQIVINKHSFLLSCIVNEEFITVDIKPIIEMICEGRDKPEDFYSEEYFGKHINNPIVQYALVDDLDTPEDFIDQIYDKLDRRCRQQILCRKSASKDIIAKVMNDKDNIEPIKNKMALCVANKHMTYYPRHTIKILAENYAEKLDGWPFVFARDAGLLSKNATNEVDGIILQKILSNPYMLTWWRDKIFDCYLQDIDMFAIFNTTEKMQNTKFDILFETLRMTKDSTDKDMINAETQTFEILKNDIRKNEITKGNQMKLLLELLTYDESYRGYNEIKDLINVMANKTQSEEVLYYLITNYQHKLEMQYLDEFYKNPVVSQRILQERFNYLYSEYKIAENKPMKQGSIKSKMAIILRAMPEISYDTLEKLIKINNESLYELLFSKNQLTVEQAKKIGRECKEANDSVIRLCIKIKTSDKIPTQYKGILLEAATESLHKVHTYTFDKKGDSADYKCNPIRLPNANEETIKQIQEVIKTSRDFYIDNEDVKKMATAIIEALNDSIRIDAICKELGAEFGKEGYYEFQDFSVTKKLSEDEIVNILRKMSEEQRNFLEGTIPVNKKLIPTINDLQSVIDFYMKMDMCANFYNANAKLEKEMLMAIDARLNYSNDEEKIEW